MTNKSVCNKETLDGCTVPELKDIAKKSKCVGYSNKKKDELVKLIKKCRKSSSSGSKRKSPGSGSKRKSSVRKSKIKTAKCDTKTLDGCTVADLKDIAKKSKCTGYSNKKKDELVKLIKKCRKSSSSGSKRKSSESGSTRKTSVRKSKVKSTKCDKKTLDGCTVADLKDIAKKSKCTGYTNKKKDELVKLIKKCRKQSGSSSGRKSTRSGSKKKSKKNSNRKSNTDCDIDNLEKCTITQLKAIAKSNGCPGYSKYNKDDTKLLINLIRYCIKPKSPIKPATPDVFNPKFKMGEFVIFEGQKGKVGAIYRPVTNPFGIKNGHDDEYRYNLYINNTLLKEKAPESQLKLAKS